MTVTFLSRCLAVLGVCVYDIMLNCSRGLYKSYFRVLELRKGPKRGPIERVKERAQKKSGLSLTQDLKT